MSSTEPAFGRLFQQLIELDVIKINMEPLDALGTGRSHLRYRSITHSRWKISRDSG